MTRGGMTRGKASSVMSPGSSVGKENKAVVLRLVEDVVNGGAFDQLGELLADDFVAHGLGTAGDAGPAELRALISTWRAAFPDWRDHVASIVAEDDLVVIRIEATGTHSGPLLNIPPTGQKVRWGMIETLRLRDGKVVEQWGYSDFGALLKRLRSIAGLEAARYRDLKATVDNHVDGLWVNELGSSMQLESHDRGRLSGSYMLSEQVSGGASPEKLALTGFVEAPTENGDLPIGFVVTWPSARSITAWLGHWDLGRQVITATWLFTGEMGQGPGRPSTLVGSDVFTRSAEGDVSTS
jgi:predicted ester cyclase